MYVLTQILIVVSSLTLISVFFVKKNAVGVAATFAAMVISLIATPFLWEEEPMSLASAMHITYYEYGGSAWLEDEDIECKLYVHYGALNLMVFDEDNRIGKEGVCIWRNADWERVIEKAVGDRNEKPKDIMFLGHGLEDGSTIRFGEVMTYLDLMTLVKKGGGRVGVLSCRGKDGEDSETASLNTINPYLENGLWIWGEEGKVIKADLKKQVKAFFEKP